MVYGYTPKEKERKRKKKKVENRMSAPMYTFKQCLHTMYYDFKPRV